MVHLILARSADLYSLLVVWLGLGDLLCSHLCLVVDMSSGWVLSWENSSLLHVVSYPLGD